jgi:SNF2 family DNA or RNA helicase
LLSEQQREYDRAKAIKGLYGHHRREKAARLSFSGKSSLVTEAIAEVTKRRGEKVVMYAESLKLLARLAEALRQAGMPFASIEGKDDKAFRDSSVAMFLAPTSGVDVLIGSRVIEYGLNLQAARVLISLDASYNPAREQQREGRIRRIGSPHATYEHLTLLPDTDLNRRKLDTLRSRELVQLQGGLR